MITVVEQSGVTVGHLAAMNQPGSGVVAFDCPVNATQFNAIAHTMFDALGHTSAAAGNTIRATRQQVPLLTVALLSRPIHTAVADNAQRCGTASLTQLIHTTASADTHLTLIMRGRVPDSVSRVIDAWPHHRSSWSHLQRKVAAHLDTRDPPHVETPKFPEVPDTEFPHFLTGCRELLSDPDAATVDREYRRVLRSIRQEVPTERADGTAALASLRRQLCDATSTDHAVTIARAAAAAVFPAGLLLTCPGNQLRASITREPYFTARTHPGWAQLHTYRRPERAAVAVLAAIGCTAAQICSLTVTDADTVHQRLPAPAQPHLRRLLLHRDLHGAAPTDPLLTLADGRPTNPRWVREVLLELGRSTSVPADRQRRRTVRDDDYQWAARLGIRVRSIT
jgi:predicted nucleic acid-binding Zn ribbon protein